MKKLSKQFYWGTFENGRHGMHLVNEIMKIFSFWIQIVFLNSRMDDMKLQQQIYHIIRLQINSKFYIQLIQDELTLVKILQWLKSVTIDMLIFSRITIYLISDSRVV